MVTSKALSLFENLNQLTPYAVGFDRIFTQLNTYAVNNATSTGFSPYNIRKGGDTLLSLIWPWQDLVRKILKSK